MTSIRGRAAILTYLLFFGLIVASSLVFVVVNAKKNPAKLARINDRCAIIKLKVVETQTNLNISSSEIYVCVNKQADDISLETGLSFPWKWKFHGC